MKKFTILVPTTKNVVGITDITEEDKGVLPVVCKSNELRPLDISNDYKNFIQNPTGIIEKLVNAQSFRLDLTDEIQTGESWQLGFAIAHLLKYRNSIEYSKSKSDLFYKSDIIWTTGKINSNLDILDVEHVEVKLKNSLSLFRKAKKKKLKILILVSSKNLQTILNFRKEYNDEEKIFDDIEIKPLNNLNELSKLLEINFQISKPFNQKNKTLKNVKYISLILILIFITYFLSGLIQNIKKYYNLLNSEDLHITLSEDDENDKFLPKFSVFVFRYLQSYNRKSISNYIVIDFVSRNMLNGKNSISNCGSVSKILNQSIYNYDCEIDIRVKNISEKNLFIWIYRNNYNSKFKVPILSSFLNANEEIIINNKKTFGKIIFVFGKKFNPKIEKWLRYINKDPLTLFKQLKRISTSGFSYKVYEINKNINILQIK